MDMAKVPGNHFVTITENLPKFAKVCERIQKGEE
jgi:hypothetical protein